MKTLPLEFILKYFLFFIIIVSCNQSQRSEESLDASKIDSLNIPSDAFIEGYKGLIKKSIIKQYNQKSIVKETGKVIDTAKWYLKVIKTFDGKGNYVYQLNVYQNLENHSIDTIKINYFKENNKTFSRETPDSLNRIKEYSWGWDFWDKQYEKQIVLKKTTGEEIYRQIIAYNDDFQEIGNKTFFYSEDLTSTETTKNKYNKQGEIIEIETLTQSNQTFLKVYELSYSDYDSYQMPQKILIKDKLLNDGLYVGTVIGHYLYY